jgi:hypothetical protein
LQKLQSELKEKGFGIINTTLTLDKLNVQLLEKQWKRIFNNFDWVPPEDDNKLPREPQPSTLHHSASASSSDA